MFTNTLLQNLSVAQWSTEMESTRQAIGINQDRGNTLTNSCSVGAKEAPQTESRLWCALKMIAWHSPLSPEFEAGTLTCRTSSKRTLQTMRPQRSLVPPRNVPKFFASLSNVDAEKHMDSGLVGGGAARCHLLWPNGSATSLWQTNLRGSREDSQLVFFVSRGNRTWRRSTVAQSTRLTEPLGSHVPTQEQN